MSSTDVTIHPTATALAAFLHGRLSGRETGSIADHLLSSCERCEAIISELKLAERSNSEMLLELATGFESASYEHSDECDAAALCDELLTFPESRRSIVALNSERFTNRAVILELLDRAWSLRYTDPSEMLDMASLANSMASALLAGQEDERLANDLCARTLASVGNAERIRSNLRRSESLFQKAAQHIELGTGDPLELAHHLYLRSTLETAKGECSLAMKWAKQARHTFEEYGEEHLSGMATANQASAAVHSDQIELAASLYLQAMSVIDPTVERTTFIAVRHNRAVLLHEQGFHREAMDELQEVKALYCQQKDRTPLLRLKQLEAKIALEMGHMPLAEKRFLEARNGFLAAGLGGAAAELSLELALLYSSQERHREVAAIAEAVVPIFQSCELHKEVIAALLLFRESVARQAITEQSLLQMLDFLQVHQADPEAKLAAFIE